MTQSTASPTGQLAKDSRQDRTQWGLAIGAITLGLLLFVYGRGTFAGPGQSVTYVITVVPKDAVNLDCASSQTFAGRRCGYDEGTQAVTVERRLRPYVTTGRELLLLGGVFESKGAAAWLMEANAKGDAARVTLECRAKVFGTAPRVSVRWSQDSAFQPESDVTVADVDDCVVKR